MSGQTERESSIVALIERLRRLDVQVWAEGERLRCNAPKGVLDQALRAELAAHKTELLRFLRQAEATSRQLVPPPTRRSGGGPAPLSFAQERLWLVEQVAPGLPTYIIPAVVRLAGRLDVAALRRSLRGLLVRHEVLRSSITMLDEQPRQRVGGLPRELLPLLDLQALPPAHRARAAEQLADAATRTPFDLARGPLLRATVARLGEREHVLLLSLHHIICDGWSVAILIRELAAHYAAERAGQPPRLPELPLQYADFALWQREWLQGDLLAAQFAYWRRQLAEIPALNLPADHVRPAVQSYRGAAAILHLPARLTAQLKALSGHEGATLFMTLLGAFQVLLARYSGQRDIVVGAPIANRTYVELEPLIGFFVNTLVLRTDLSGKPDFRAVLRRVREVALSAYAHQDLPFERLVEELRPARDASYAPLFQVVFALQNTPSERLSLDDLELYSLAAEHRTAKFDLGLALEEHGEELIGAVEYSIDLFEATTIARMLAHFRALLEGIVADPDRPYTQLPLLNAAERHQLLAEWNSLADRGQRTENRELESSTPVCLHQLFEQQVVRAPDAVAAVFYQTNDERRTTNDEGSDSSFVVRRSSAVQLTYSELDRRANQLAHHLRSLGVGPASIVGVCLDRTLDQLQALLGIFKAGGTYLPLDPTYPAERISFMLEDSGAGIVIVASNTSSDKVTRRQGDEVTDAAFDLTLSSSHLITGSRRTVDLRADWSAIARQPPTNPNVGARPDDLAYVIYTSGTTGAPKAVLVGQRQFAATLQATRPLFAPDVATVLPAIASFAFDIALFELLAPLLLGGTTIIVPKELVLDLPAFRRVLGTITFLHTLPSLMRQIVDFVRAEGPTGGYRNLARALVGGDAVPGELVRDMQATFPSAQIYISYGPTEATIISAIYRVPRGQLLDKHIIGRPLANAIMQIHDAQGELAPIGVPGELYIGGPAVARGYRNRPQLTAERFIPNPFAEVSGIGYRVLGAEPSDTRYPTPNTRLYRTGDLARYLADGTIEYLGRVDDQVKLRGFRIELGEIEAALSKHPAVREAVVVVRADAPPAGEAPDQRLVAYVVPATNDERRTTNEDRGLKIEDSDAGVSKSPSSILHPLSSDLRAFLKDRLPDYMLPAAFVILDALPLTPNGKVDRRALPPPADDPALSGSIVAPRDLLEMQLVLIWEQVLRRQPIGVTDDFFALGGHSLIAVGLMRAIREHFGRDLPVGTLLQAPTIEQLAAILRQTYHPPASPLVAIRPEGARPPMFWVHTAGGHVLCYMPLAHHLPKDQPLYALQSPGLYDERERYDDIGAMAARYIHEIRAVQPEGPYLLGGWSMGGVVAFEIARQLAAQGCEVPLVILVDSFLPDTATYPAQENDDTLYTYFLADTLSVFGKDASDLPALVRDHGRLLRVFATTLWAMRHQVKDASDLPALARDHSRLFKVFAANLRALRRYVPQPYPGDLLLVRAAEAPAQPRGWDALCAGRLVTHTIPGDHYSILQEPHVAALAEQIERHLASRFS